MADDRLALGVGLFLQALHAHFPNGVQDARDVLGVEGAVRHPHVRAVHDQGRLFDPS